MKQLLTYPLFSNIAIIVVLSSLVWTTAIAPLQCFIDGKISMELYDVLEGESEKEEQEKKEELKDKIPMDFQAVKNAYFNHCLWTSIR